MRSITCTGAAFIGFTQLALAQPAPNQPVPASSEPAPAPSEPAPTAAPAPPPVLVVETPPPRERHGLFATAGLWGGEISCDGMDCGGFREAGGGGLQVGYMLRPRLAVLLDGWAMTSSKNDISITFLTSTIGLRAWLARVIWVQGGVGSGHARLRWGPFTTGTSDNVPVATVSAGIEIVRSKRWALDVAFKVAQGTRTDVETNDVRTGRSSGLGVSFIGFLH